MTYTRAEFSEKHQQAIRLFESGLGYKRVATALQQKPYTVRDWARNWRFHVRANRGGDATAGCKPHGDCSGNEDVQADDSQLADGGASARGLERCRPNRLERNLRRSAPRNELTIPTHFD